MSLTDRDSLASYLSHLLASKCKSYKGVRKRRAMKERLNEPFIQGDCILMGLALKVRSILITSRSLINSLH